MICEFCGGETRKKKVKKQHWLRNRLYIVENVEAEVCQECGERYFHATTLDAIDRYLLKEHAVKQQLSVEVMALWELPGHKFCLKTECCRSSITFYASINSE